MFSLHGQKPEQVGMLTRDERQAEQARIAAAIGMILPPLVDYGRASRRSVEIPGNHIRRARKVATLILIPGWGVTACKDKPLCGSITVTQEGKYIFEEAPEPLRAGLIPVDPMYSVGIPAGEIFDSISIHMLRAANEDVLHFRRNPDSSSVVTPIQTDPKFPSLLKLNSPSVVTPNQTRKEIPLLSQAA